MQSYTFMVHARGTCGVISRFSNHGILASQSSTPSEADEYSDQEEGKKTVRSHVTCICRWQAKHRNVHRATVMAVCVCLAEWRRKFCLAWLAAVHIKTDRQACMHAEDVMVRPLEIQICIGSAALPRSIRPFLGYRSTVTKTRQTSSSLSLSLPKRSSAAIILSDFGWLVPRFWMTT